MAPVDDICRHLQLYFTYLYLLYSIFTYHRPVRYSSWGLINPHTKAYSRASSSFPVHCPHPHVTFWLSSASPLAALQSTHCIAATTVASYQVLPRSGVNQITSTLCSWCSNCFLFQFNKIQTPFGGLQEVRSSTLLPPVETPPNCPPLALSVLATLFQFCPSNTKLLAALRTSPSWALFPWLFSCLHSCSSPAMRGLSWLINLKFPLIPLIRCCHMILAFWRQVFGYLCHPRAGNNACYMAGNVVCVRKV